MVILETRKNDNQMSLVPGLTPLVKKKVKRVRDLRDFIKCYTTSVKPLKEKKK